jgi:hypothetical protein
LLTVRPGINPDQIASGPMRQEKLQMNVICNEPVSHLRVMKKEKDFAVEHRLSLVQEEAWSLENAV